MTRPIKQDSLAKQAGEGARPEGAHGSAGPYAASAAARPSDAAPELSPAASVPSLPSGYLVPGGDSSESSSGAPFWWIPGEGPYRLQNVPWSRVAAGECL